jgi:hypothetical protein
MSDSDADTSISTNGTSIDIKAQAFDHAVEGIAAVGIVVTALGGVADATVVGGLVSLGLGKRVLSGK